MPAILRGPIDAKMERDKDGYRIYRLRNRVETLRTDGPLTALSAAGLPLPGAAWIFNGEGDIWAGCKQDANVTPDQWHDGEHSGFWIVEQVFSNRGDSKRCKETQIDNPLLEPPRISGTFTKYTEEAFLNRFGAPIRNSAHEQIRGSAVEFDANRPQIKIEQNLASLDLSLLCQMIDRVNDNPLWGLPRRTIKLSNATWEPKYYGQCFKYYTLGLEFDINFETFDRILLDEGTKVLNGQWNPTTGNWDLKNINGVAPDQNNPTHFIRFTDRKGNPCRVVLNGFGRPATTVTTTDGRFVSIVTGNIGNQVSDSTKWVAVKGSTFTRWDEDTVYLYGEIVDNGFEDAFVCIQDNVGEAPQLLGPYDFWESIGPLSGLIDQGEWDEATTYPKGSFVHTSAGVTQAVAGKIRIEKYPEANFLLLGIPTIL